MHKVGTIFFVFNLLFLALKIGGAQKKLPQPCFEVPSFMLGALGMVKTKNFVLALLLLTLKVQGQVKKKIALVFSMEIWAWLRTMFLLLVSYFQC
jgi:hypothetical protein